MAERLFIYLQLNYSKGWISISRALQNAGNTLLNGFYKRNFYLQQKVAAAG